MDTNPVLDIVKTADKATYKVGETITWTIKVTNISNDTAYDVKIVDETTGDSKNVGTLAPGASDTLTVTTKATAAGQVSNTAVTTWTDNDEIPDEDETDEPKKDKDEEIVEVEEPETEPTEPETEPTEPETEPTEPETEPTEPVVEIPDEEVPLDREPEVEIPDEDVPLADVPKTGDMSVILAILAAASGAGMAGLNLRKKEEDEE